MNDDFLLGINFIKATLCDTITIECCVRLGKNGRKIPATFKRIAYNNYRVSRLVVVYRIVVSLIPSK